MAYVSLSRSKVPWARSRSFCIVSRGEGGRTWASMGVGIVLRRLSSLVGDAERALRMWEKRAGCA